MSITIYIIVHTSADADKLMFPRPTIPGSFLSIDRARSEFEKLIEAEKKELDRRYDREEREGDCWQAYKDGYAAGCFTRYEIIAAELYGGTV